MVSYIQSIAALIRENLPEGTSVPEDSDGLFRIYAVLLRSKGADTQATDVHDAWSAWMSDVDPNHDAIKPFAELDEATRAEDSPFLHAIRQASKMEPGD